MTRPTYSQALTVAAKILGGKEKLAKRLGTTESELARWMKGDATPPMAAFLEAVDIMLDHNGY